MLALRRGNAVRRVAAAGRPRVQSRTVFGGANAFEVSKATARRRRFDAVLRALGPPPAPVKSAVESAVETALRRHATEGSLADAQALRAAIADALPLLSALQTAPLARSVTVTEIAKAAAAHAPAASKAAIASEHQSAMTAALAMTPGGAAEGRIEQSMLLPHRKAAADDAKAAATATAPTATPAEVYASGSAPAAQHNAAVEALASGAPRPAAADASAVSAGANGAGGAVAGTTADTAGGSDEPPELPPDDLSVDELQTVHALRMAAVLASLERRPWGVLRTVAVEGASVGEVKGSQDGEGIQVGALLQVVETLASGNTLRAMQVCAAASSIYM